MTRIRNALSRFTAWRRERPFVGGLLVVLSGLEMFLSSQLDLGTLHIQLGIEGFQATIIPLGLVLLGVLGVLMPAHRIFYGVIALALAVYSIIGVNLGGFVIGMLLAAVGGILVVSWLPRTTPDVTPGAHDALPAQSAPEPPPLAERSAEVRATGRGHRSTAAALALVLLAAAGGIGAAKAPADPPIALCIPILLPCPAPAPGPDPSSPPDDPIGGLVDGLGQVLGGSGGGLVTDPGTAAPLVIGPDAGAPAFTLPAGQLGGSSIAISGIHQLGLVTVAAVDGTRFPVIKLVADDIVITGFLLDVRRATGPSLVSSASRMELHGDVQVYLDSVTGTTLGGVALSLGTQATPPPGDELPPELLRVNLGLVGVTAGSITYSGLHQELHE